MRMGTTISNNGLGLLSLGVSVCLGLAACGDDQAGTASNGATEASTVASGDTQGTTQGSTVPTTAPTTDGPGSNSMDADSTPTSTTPPGTTTDATDTTPGTTTAVQTSTDPSTTAVSASTTDGTTTGNTTDTTGGSTGGEGPCTKSIDCPDGQVCAAGTCVPFDGDCTGDKDCHGDTYCCSKGCLPMGEQPGACIDFGLDPVGDSHEDCEGLVPVGLFQPSVQCEWSAPPNNDPFANHRNVLTTPLAAPLPHFGMDSTELVIVTYNFTDGGAQSGYGSDPNYFGVIRILDTRTCSQLETIHDPNNKMIAATPPAIGDLDGDGTPEIVTHRASTGVIAFKWDGAKYATYWVALNTGVINTTRWDGPSIHDLDNDGLPEVISASAVFDGVTGDRLNPGQIIPGAGAGIIPVLGDVDNDGNIDLIAGAV